MKHVGSTNTGELLKRSLRIAGHRTSLALEKEFWATVDELAKWKGQTIPVLIAQIDAERQKSAPEASLASAVRVSCLKFLLAWDLPTRVRTAIAEAMAA